MRCCARPFAQLPLAQGALIKSPSVRVTARTRRITRAGRSSEAFCFGSFTGAASADRCPDVDGSVSVLEGEVPSRIVRDDRDQEPALLTTQDDDVHAPSIEHRLPALTSVDDVRIALPD